MKNIFLIVGLGNPEGKYFNTYHNVGFLAAEKLAESLGCTFKKKGNMLLAESTAEKCKIIILKPLTYMNNSGQAVTAICRKLKILPQNVIIIFDDIALDKGSLRIRFGGSSGGHNGIKSIIELLGTDKFYRVRIGIKPQKAVVNLANYVLGQIKDIEALAINDGVSACLEIAKEVALEVIQQKYNKVNKEND